MTSSMEKAQMNRRAAYFSIGVAIVLVLIKAYAWFATDSLSLLSSLLDSSLDVVVSVMNLLAIAYAAKPADQQHSFGHNAIEDVVGLVQATFISASALFLVYEAIHRLREPQAVLYPEIGVGVLCLSLLLTFSVVMYQRRVIRTTQSAVVEADSLHYWSDFLVNLSIIGSLLLASRPGWGIADPLIATGIACYIFHAAVKLGRRAFDNIMNKELPEGMRSRIVEALNAETRIAGFHDLKTTRSGTRPLVHLHLELDESLSLKDAHAIAASVRQKLLAITGEADIIIHEDPVPLRA